jgi:hypothetical protein
MKIDGEFFRDYAKRRVPRVIRSVALGSVSLEWHAVDRALEDVRSPGLCKAEPVGVTQKSTRTQPLEHSIDRQYRVDGFLALFDAAGLALN